MLRIVLSAVTMAAALALPAASVHGKPFVIHRWHGYGFLPGYEQPLSNSLPLYMQKDAMRRYAQQNKRPWYNYPTPRYYDWTGEQHYFGQPGFYRGHYNGGSFGPCWTQTPIGPMWNCGR